MSIDFKLPASIDPSVPVGQLTFEQITSIWGAVCAYWGRTCRSPEELAAHARAISAGRMASISPERRSEIARQAARARWAKKAEGV